MIGVWTELLVGPTKTRCFHEALFVLKVLHKILHARCERVYVGAAHEERQSLFTLLVFFIHALYTHRWQGPILIHNIYVSPFGHVCFFLNKCSSRLNGKVLSKQLFNMREGAFAILKIRLGLAAYKVTIFITDDKPRTAQLSKSARSTILRLTLLGL